MSPPEFLASTPPCTVLRVIEPLEVLATFSRLIVEDYLRGELGFRGAIVSDDLEMGAIVQSCPMGEAAVRAAQAGHDLLLVCHTERSEERRVGKECRSRWSPYH